MYSIQINVISLSSSLKGHLSLLDGIRPNFSWNHVQIADGLRNHRHCPGILQLQRNIFTKHSTSANSPNKSGKKTSISYYFNIQSCQQAMQTHKTLSKRLFYVHPKFSNHVVTTLICDNFFCVWKQHSPCSHYIIALMELQGTDSQISGTEKSQCSLQVSMEVFNFGKMQWLWGVQFWDTPTRICCRIRVSAHAKSAISFTQYCTNM